MEKLQPIIKQRFWILLGVTLILSLTGWWLATSTMVKEIQARTEQIKQSFEKVPKGKVPGDSWSAKLTELNNVQKKSIATTQASLWYRQLKQLMDWPPTIQPAGYLGDFSNDAKEDYKDVYVEEVKRVWKTLRPLEPDGSGIVNYPLENMYQILRKEPGWKGAITHKEMWDIKEDLLLLETLFESIATVNGGPDVMRTVDMVHQIDVLELRGGGTKPKAAAASRPPLTSKTPGGDLPVVPADFNPIEEFGDDGNPTKAMARSGRPGADGPARGGVGGGGEKKKFERVVILDRDEPQVPQAQAGGTAKPGKPVERYIEKGDKGVPYKTRGFYLSVLMDHNKIPQLLAELTANDRSVWPIEIIRVQTCRIHEDLQTGTAATRPMNVDMRDDLATPPQGGGMKQSGPAADTDQAKTAAANLAKALANPAIAQVSIAGVFTLYQKVDLPEPPAATPTAPVSTPSQVDATPAESTSDVPADDSTTSKEDMSAEPSAEAQPEMKDADPNATSEPTDPAAPTTGSSDSPPAKKEDDEK